jgi:hypothetical protein
VRTRWENWLLSYMQESPYLRTGWIWRKWKSWEPGRFSQKKKVRTAQHWYLPEWEGQSSAGWTFCSANSTCDVNQHWGNTLNILVMWINNTRMIWINGGDTHQLCCGTGAGRTCCQQTEHVSLSVFLSGTGPIELLPHSVSFPVHHPFLPFLPCWVKSMPILLLTYQGTLLILRIFCFHLHLGRGVSVQYKIFVDYFGN